MPDRMKVTINDIEIPIVDTNAVIARDSVNTFLEVIRKSSIASNNDALFITTLIMMFKKSSELLDELGERNIQYIMNSYYSAVQNAKSKE